MIHMNNIHPLTDFKRNTAAFRRRLRKSGQPEVLTVEGRPELVVQDADAYQKLLDALDRAEALQGIKDGLESMRNGEGKEEAAFFDELRKDLRKSNKKKK